MFGVWVFGCLVLISVLCWPVWTLCCCIFVVLDLLVAFCFWLFDVLDYVVACLWGFVLLCCALASGCLGVVFGFRFWFLFCFCLCFWCCFGFGLCLAPCGLSFLRRDL